ncbi:MAG: FHA domain-containing protein [Planctomycetes bacterium]|nr:FHA domain-containing protein [Planctomycetota bacterium]
MHDIESGWEIEWVIRGADGEEIELPVRPHRSLTVGRDLTSDISLVDAGISRHHATICEEEGGLWIEDLHSQNGTYVNMERVFRAPLQEGDLITFGRVHFTLLSRRRRTEQDVELLRPLSSSDLAQLLRITRRLTTAQDPTTVFQRALDALSEALDCDRGAVLGCDPSHGGFQPLAVRARNGFPELESLRSEPVLQTVVQGRKVRALYRGRDGFRDPHPEGMAESLDYPTVLVPVHAWQRPVGVIYLDRHLQGRPFRPAEVDFLSAFAWISEGIFGASQHACDLLLSKERLEAHVGHRGLRRTERLLAADAAAASEVAGGFSRFFAQWTRQLDRLGRRMEEAQLAEEERDAVAELRRLTLTARASKLLWIAPPTARDAVDLSRLARCALRSSGRSEDDLRLAESMPRALAPPEALEVVLKLLAEAALAGEDEEPAGEPEPASEPLLAVEVAADGNWITIRFRTAVPRRREIDRDRELFLDLAEQLASRCLHGTIRARAAEGRAIELDLPVAAGALDETRVL